MSRPKILPHYAAVAEYVHNNRFAIGSQIQRRFAVWMPSERTAHHQLAALVDLGYLTRAPVRSTSPNFPFVYLVTTRGLKAVRDAYAVLGHRWIASGAEVARSKGTALNSILHELMLTEIDLSICRSLQGREDVERLLVERRYFRRANRLQFQQHGRRYQLIPDLGFLTRSTIQTSGRFEIRALLSLAEFCNGTESLPRVERKLRRYEAWAASPEGERYLRQLYARFGYEPRRLSFRLLWIVRSDFGKSGDYGRLLDTLVQTLELSASMRERIWLTTVSDLRANHKGENSTDWLRVRDTRSWLPHYRAWLKTQLGLSPLRRLRRQRQWLEPYVAAMPRHALFAESRRAPVPAIAPTLP